MGEIDVSLVGKQCAVLVSLSVGFEETVVEGLDVRKGTLGFTFMPEDAILDAAAIYGCYRLGSAMLIYRQTDR